MKSTLVLAFLVPATLLGAGCSDNEQIRTDNHTIVRVVEATTGLPVAGVKIVLMRRTTNTPASDPLRSDADGNCVFDVIPAGDRAVLAFGGGQWRQFGETDTRFEKGGEGVVEPLTPPAYPDPVVRVVPIPTPGGARISGLVVDADTGEPLGSVFLSTTPYPDAYSGNIGASDDVTLADGGFRVHGIRFIEDPRTGRVAQVVPLWVTRHGYRPRLWSYEPAPGEPLDDITDVRIPLQRDAGGARGALRGRLVRGGQPVPWVFVGLGWAELPSGGKAGAGMTGWTARSDHDGVFVFGDLPVGRYVLQPGFLAGDGAFYPDQEANFARVVTADTTTEAGDFLLLWELHAAIPVSGATVPAATRLFAWSPAPSLASYDFILDRGEPVRVDGPQYERPVDAPPLTPGPHVWYVIGYDAQGGEGGVFAGLAEFLVPEAGTD